MNQRSVRLMFLIITLTAPCLAARKLHSPGMHWHKVFRANPAAFNGGMRYGRYYNLTLRNVGTVTQTVSVEATLTDAKFFSHGYNNNATFGAISFREFQIDNVNNFSGAYSVQYISSGTRTLTSQQVTLAPSGQTGSTKIVGVAAEYYGPIPVATTSAQGALALTVSVSEDRGAINATLTDWSHCHGECYTLGSTFEAVMAIDSIASTFLPLNGGRPF